MRGLLMLALGFVLSGCLARDMKSWEGSHKDKLIQQWGPPEREAVLSDGGSTLMYRQWQGGLRGSGSVCHMIFNADKDGIIRSWRYYGC